MLYSGANLWRGGICDVDAVQHDTRAVASSPRMRTAAAFPYPPSMVTVTPAGYQATNLSPGNQKRASRLDPALSRRRRSDQSGQVFAKPPRRSLQPDHAQRRHLQTPSLLPVLGWLRWPGTRRGRRAHRRCLLREKPWLRCCDKISG